MIARYDARLSGPLLDRVDVHVTVQPVPWRELDGPAPGSGEGGRTGQTSQTSEMVRRRIEAARGIQARRMAALGLSERSNAGLPVEALDEAVAATPEARVLLGRAVDRLALSARAAHRTMRVARTIADLAGEPRVGPVPMAEAVGLRGPSGPLAGSGWTGISPRE